MVTSRSICIEDLSASQLAIIRQLVIDDLYPIFTPAENGLSHELSEVRWGSGESAPAIADILALMHADLIELEWEDEYEVRVWTYELTESAEALLSI
jgi:hypothetical protein